jgi:hypothetical protein
MLAGKVKKQKLTKEESIARRRAWYRERNRKLRQCPEYKRKHLALKKAWRAKNRERYLDTTRAYDRKQLKENNQRRLSKNLRHRLRKAMLGETRGLSAVRDLGMSIEDFRLYIEKLFVEDMTWDNYGEWHIDHIKPLSAFDLTDDEQVKEACHYSNLQPLWALDNMKKGYKQQSTCCRVSSEALCEQQTKEII